MTNSADSDQLASSEANWSGATLFIKGRVYPGSAGQGLRPLFLRHGFVVLLFFAQEYMVWVAKAHFIAVPKKNQKTSDYLENCEHYGNCSLK